MRRGRAKGKKLYVTNEDDPGSADEEKIPAQKRRGRPQKSLKDEIDEDEAEKIEDEDSEDRTGVQNKDMKNKSAQTGKKRRRNAQEKEKVDSVIEEKRNGTRSSTEETNKSNGFRQNGNRRKNKPHRAAEAVVECN